MAHNAHCKRLTLRVQPRSVSQSGGEVESGRRTVDVSSQLSQCMIQSRSVVEGRNSAVYHLSLFHSDQKCNT